MFLIRIEKITREKKKKRVLPVEGRVEERERLPENLIFITQNKREQQGEREVAAASVMTVDKQQKWDGARHMSRDEREPRKKMKNKEGKETSPFFVGSPTGKEGKWMIL